LSRTLGGFAQGADEAFAGGQKIASGLGSIDARARSAVDDAYNAARDSAGRHVELDNVGFVKSANDALDEGMLGHYLPDQVRNMLNDVSTGKIPLNVNTAVQMDSVLSAAQRGALPAERKALGAVRDALNNATPANNTGADALAAFQGARKLAAERFKLHEAIPALKAAANGDVPADDFVRKFVINGDALELRGMAKLLKEHAPEAYQQARAQVGAELRSAPSFAGLDSARTSRETSRFLRSGSTPSCGRWERPGFRRFFLPRRLRHCAQPEGSARTWKARQRDRR